MERVQQVRYIPRFVLIQKSYFACVQMCDDYSLPGPTARHVKSLAGYSAVAGYFIYRQQSYTMMFKADKYITVRMGYESEISFTLDTICPW